MEYESLDQFLQDANDLGHPTPVSPKAQGRCYAHAPMPEPSCARCREDMQGADPASAGIFWRGVDAIRDALDTLSVDSKEFREVWGTSPDAWAMQEDADAARDRDFLEED